MLEVDRREVQSIREGQRRFKGRWYRRLCTVAAADAWSQHHHRQLDHYCHAWNAQETQNEVIGMNRFRRFLFTIFCYTFSMKCFCFSWLASHTVTVCNTKAHNRIIGHKTYLLCAQLHQNIAWLCRFLHDSEWPFYVKFCFRVDILLEYFFGFRKQMHKMTKN